eukprot:TRINITY_DN1600_c0_g1_i2.p2 TRINITY_DN1600_c0_g1~~TRINITY_DN1600_c0_g1_i2.p2  ORF type:complete len:270 (+),score=81.08 TRINITY_DN1600_c0_g1_i2:61-870(+)
MALLRRVPSSRLFVSEPNPAMFGNGRNPSDWKARGWTNANWLKSRFHFSFAEYRGTRNNNFGVLRVMNDDLVQPRTGFGTHGHRDAEILTYVVDGFLTHQDSMGSSETLGRGAVQFMTAGRGVMHSEQNSSDVPCRFIQTWVTPAERGLKPRYGSHAGDKEARHNRVHRLAGPVGSSAPIEVAQDVDMFVTELDGGKSVEITLPEGRQMYLLCVEGLLALEHGGDARLEQHDAAELHGRGSDVRISAGESGGHALFFVMKDDGSARGDL